MAVCERCGRTYSLDEVRDEFITHFANHSCFVNRYGDVDNIDDEMAEHFNENLCLECNDADLTDFATRLEEDLKKEDLEVLSEYGLSHMRGCGSDSYNRNYTTHTGEYRTYEEYLESGGPVDGCDDALWLHDQE